MSPVSGSACCASNATTAQVAPMPDVVDRQMRLVADVFGDCR
jgi:hypothetical protein